MALGVQEQAMELKEADWYGERHSQQAKCRNTLWPLAILEFRNWLGAAETPVFYILMARTRERQPCRRGRGRGAPGRPPAAAEAHHHCCCQYCFRRAGIPHLQAFSFLDSDAPPEQLPRPLVLPAYGSAIFRLGNLNVHISILFIRRAEEEHDNSRVPTSANMENMAGEQLGEAKGKEPIQAKAQDASTSKAGEDSEEELVGWGYPIVEMEPEETEPADQFL